MKKTLIISFALVVIIISGFTINKGKFFAGPVEKACKNAYEGKCLNGQTANIPFLTSYTAIIDYCTIEVNNNQNQCTVTECVDRIAVFTQYTPGGNKSNPCLPIF
jgi:hypothetical protein